MRSRLLLLLFVICLGVAAPCGAVQLGCQGCDRDYDRAYCDSNGPGHWADCYPRTTCWRWADGTEICQYDCGGNRCYDI